MKISISKQEERGLTLVELFVVMAVIAIFAAMIIPADSRPKARAYRIQCVNNLKQIALACRVWEGDDSDKYPPRVSRTNGGSMEFITGPNEWHHFQVMSNELSTPKVLICPNDPNRLAATNFDWLNNSNVSFFFGVDAEETHPQMILSGDRNITNGAPVKNGLLELTTNRPAGWTREIHNEVGNIALADGSVSQVTTIGLQAAVANTGIVTNRLQMPILSP